MESASDANYGVDMAHDLAALLGSALREIRTRTTRTQDGWADATGMSQSYLSSLERGAAGWDAIRNVADAVERAGADPLDLLRLAVSQVEDSDEDRELLSLWRALDPVTRTATLHLLRGQASARAAAR